MDYHETVKPFLNTNDELDEKVLSLWSLYSPDGEIDVNEGIRQFLRIATESPNIHRLDHYVPHCLLVSRKCGEFSRKIKDNYEDLPLAEQINPSSLAFMGLTEDSFYLIGGDGSNNENGEDSNPYHEILTYIQLSHLGYQELADGMALHGVAPEILSEEHKKERFTEVAVPENLNIALDILTGVDMLCTREYLPDVKGSMENALAYRIDDVNARRTPDHPIVLGFELGKSRLMTMISRLNGLLTESISPDEVQEIYGLY